MLRSHDMMTRIAQDLQRSFSKAGVTMAEMQKAMRDGMERHERLQERLREQRKDV